MFRIASFQRIRPFGCRGKERPIHAPVSPAPSKIPYSGFSPVRLQASIQRRPSSEDPTLTSPQRLSGPRALNSVVGLASDRHTRLLTPHTRPVALGSAIGSVVRQPHRLLWPHPRLWRSAPAYEFVRCVRKCQSFPNLLCLSFDPCHRPYPGGLDDFMRLFIHHRCCFHPTCRDSATAGSNLSDPAGCITRLQHSLHATARTIARPARPGLLLPSLRCRCHHQTASDMTTRATVNSRGWSSTSRTNSLMGCTHDNTRSVHAHSGVGRGERIERHYDQ
jgi:hypothetical protein